MSEISIWGDVGNLFNYLDQVGFRFNAGFGPSNTSSTFAHAPDINPTSINYKLLISTSYNVDYTISSNTISISV
jgi:hypothetical protein